MLVHSAQLNYFDKLSKLVNLKYSNGIAVIITFQTFLLPSFPSLIFEEKELED